MEQRRRWSGGAGEVEARVEQRRGWGRGAGGAEARVGQRRGKRGRSRGTGEVGV